MALRAIFTSTGQRKVGSAARPSESTANGRRRKRKAEDFREIIRGGRDPVADKRALREALTVGEVLDAYLTSEERTGDPFEVWAPLDHRSA